MRYSVTLSYDGSSFSGWQIQPNAPSVQEALESALSLALREKVTVTGAGRTDAGVNACGYVAHFDAADDIDTAALGCKLNAILPVFVRIHEVKIAKPEFHARFDARYRRYNYFIHRSKDPFVRHYSYLYTFPLDVESMNEACKLLLGTHDFSCFEKTGGANKTSICTVTEAFWAPCSPTALSLLGLPPAALAPGADSRTAGGLSCAGGDLPSGPCPSLPEASTGSFQGAASADGIPRQASPSGAFAVTTQAPTPAPTSLSAAAGSQAPENYLAFRVTADRFLRNMVRAMVGTLIDVGRGKRSPESMTALLESRDRCSAGESVPARALFLVDVRY